METTNDLQVRIIQHTLNPGWTQEHLGRESGIRTYLDGIAEINSLVKQGYRIVGVLQRHVGRDEIAVIYLQWYAQREEDV
jgi:hypothetical protein